MEAYHRLADDLRFFFLILGVVFVLLGRKGFRKELFPWMGVLLVLYGLTQYIPGTSTWGGFFYYLVPLLWLSTFIDIALKRKREGKPAMGYVYFQALVFIFWAVFAVIQYNRSRFDIELSSENLAVHRGGDNYTIEKKKLRVLAGNGTWHLKDGVANIRIVDYELYKKGDSIVTATQLIDRLVEWSGKKLEVEPDLD